MNNQIYKMDHNKIKIKTNDQSILEEIGIVKETPIIDKTKYNFHARSNVRFNEEEWIRIQNDQLVMGKSIPELLKSAYFGHLETRILMPIEERKIWLLQLRGIANNWNQIAKHLNSGFRQGWNEELIQICEGIIQIRRCLVGYCGNH